MAFEMTILAFYGVFLKSHVCGWESNIIVDGQAIFKRLFGE